jgi:hypothetical protein
MRFIYGEVKPDLHSLEHFGVKGMKWGVRRKSAKSGSSGNASPQKKRGLSTKQKVVLGTTLAVGAVAATAILSKSGRVSIRSVPSIKSSSSTTITRSTKKPMSVAEVKANSEKYWRRNPELAKKLNVQTDAKRFLESNDIASKLVSTMMADLAEAHANQSRYMQKQYPGYNPRGNPFTPAYELSRLSGR